MQKGTNKTVKVPLRNGCATTSPASPTSNVLRVQLTSNTHQSATELTPKCPAFILRLPRL